ncbi:unnamed protein product [Heligmosomoides polygyrus]|uniref:Guanine nucleotide-binding protein G(O) subunit alpha n=1 Tax=Heligmosomoides polygyrus TaxID=6339 RepID=A0A183FIW0_HELPZ|nr:unnamed protein product [Heligmosomoides polygyrus]
MGSCQSQENQELAARNKAIEKQINQDKRAGSSIVKLLLLGAGECGKSTVLKQMQILHSNGFTEEEINEKKAIVYSNVVSSICTILKKEKAIVLRVQEMGEETEPLSEEVSKAIQSLWSDPGVKKAYEMRSEYQLTDSAKYFLDACARVSEPGYRPSEQDILYSRVATTGVVEVKFKIKELDFSQERLVERLYVVTGCFVAIKTLAPGGTRTRIFCFPGSDVRLTPPALFDRT